ncbi:porin [Erwinia amylovora]|uniref:porin n=1 Tax=Erwinia amylovora TaxID=552 RepID=UPI0002CA7299|nr:porin [Erwinia amylovora]CCP06280.1 Outer membrane protein 39 [Erwinia amylovora MR1]
MMNKSTLVILITALTLTTAAQAAEIYNQDGNKLDLYGKVKAMRYLSDADSNASNNADKSYTRFGFKGQTLINDQLTGYGQWEYNFSLSNSESSSDAQSGSKTRLGFAGLKLKDYGSVDYGRNYGVIYDVEAFTDMMPEFGATGYTRTDTYMLTRGNSMLTWRNSDFFGLVDGLKIALQYQGKNEGSGTRATNVSNGDGYGASLSYKIVEGLTINGAMSSSNRLNANSASSTTSQKMAAYGSGGKAEAWAAGLKYDANRVYLAGTYAETRNTNPFSGASYTFAGNSTATAVSGYANKVQNTELVAQYQFDSGLRPSLAYVQTKAKDIENGIGDADLSKFVDIAATYFFNKNMSAFVDYKVNLLSDNNKLNLNTDDIVAVGLMYQF